MIPMGANGHNITINEAIDISSDLKKAYEEEEDVRYLIDMSKRLEGLPRHASMHAAGVVIGQKPIDEKNTIRLPRTEKIIHFFIFHVQVVYININSFALFNISHCILYDRECPKSKEIHF